MNIQNPQSADATSQALPDDSSEAASRKPAKDKDAKSFSKVLAEKSNKSPAPKTDSAQTGQPQPFRETAPVTQQGKQVSAASLPPAMQNLVQEIVVATGPKNTAQVDIQLDSKTFDGLKVSISHGADGNVSIKMTSRTPEIAAVLNRNIDQLSQALTARGVPVASMQVQTVGAPVASSGARSSSSGGRESGSRQGGRAGRQS